VGEASVELVPLDRAEASIAINVTNTAVAVPSIVNFWIRCGVFVVNIFLKVPLSIRTYSQI
jgi:hypothetical protein